MKIIKNNIFGNMISIEDTKVVILDAMSNCNEGSDVWNTYNAVLFMLTSVSDEYDAEVVSENLINEIFNN